MSRARRYSTSSRGGPFLWLYSSSVSPATLPSPIKKNSNGPARGGRAKGVNSPELHRVRDQQVRLHARLGERVGFLADGLDPLHVAQHRLVLVLVLYYIQVFSYSMFRRRVQFSKQCVLYNQSSAKSRIGATRELPLPQNVPQPRSVPSQGACKLSSAFPVQPRQKNIYSKTRPPRPSPPVTLGTQYIGRFAVFRSTKSKCLL